MGLSCSRDPQVFQQTREKMMTVMVGKKKKKKQMSLTMKMKMKVYMER